MITTKESLGPLMAECHARLMAVAKHGTPEAFSATLAGVLQRAELSISNAYDAGAQSIQVDAAAAPDAANEITKAFREYLTVHPGIKLGGHEADTVARELALIAQPDAQPAERMPSWMQYDKRYDILTIHGKRYSASMFGDDGFIAPAGTLLRVEAGDPDCVTLHKVAAAQPVAQDGALGLLKFNDDMGASITGLPAMTIKPGDEFLIFPKSPAQPSSDDTDDDWSKSEIDAAIKVDAPPCFEAVINPDVAATALRAYIKDCEAHAIVPDVGGAWHAAFLAGAASRGKAPAGATAQEVDNLFSTLRYVLGVPPARGTIQERWQALLDKIASWPLVGADAVKSAASARARELIPTAQAAPALHPKTADLVQRFSAALAEKLAVAEKKYGYSDGWASPDWMDECRQHLNAHIAKGDPRDVAAYCAFLWHHGASTAAPAAGAVAGPVDDIDAIALARYKVVPSHDSMFHRFAVVAGDGKQQLYLGRETECQNMARKFAGAFLDGAFYQSHAVAPTTAAQQGDARLGAIEQAIRDYHYALDTRQHGGVAQDRAIISICTTLEMHWEQGKEANRRATLAQKEGNTHGN